MDLRWEKEECGVKIKTQAPLAKMVAPVAAAAVLCLALAGSGRAYDPMSQASHPVESLPRALHRDRWDANCELFALRPRRISLLRCWARGFPAIPVCRTEYL